MQLQFDIEGGNFSQAGTASSEVKKILKQINIDPKILKRIVICLYEAEVNVVAHAYHGTISVDINSNRIEMVLTDSGPGIPDIEKAMQLGFSTASPEVREMGFGAGMGLPNIKNNSDRLDIRSQVGIGTTVKITVFFQADQE